MLHNRGGLFTLDEKQRERAGAAQAPAAHHHPGVHAEGRCEESGSGSWADSTRRRPTRSSSPMSPTTGLDIQQALEAGRFTKRIVCGLRRPDGDPRARGKVRNELKGAGATTCVPCRRAAGTFGYGQAVMSDGAGVHFGASEPRTTAPRYPRRRRFSRATASSSSQDSTEGQRRSGDDGLGSSSRQEEDLLSPGLLLKSIFVSCSYALRRASCDASLHGGQYLADAQVELIAGLGDVVDLCVADTSELDSFPACSVVRRDATCSSMPLTARMSNSGDEGARCRKVWLS